MASGDVLAIFTPHQNQPPAANFATLDVVTGSGEPDPVLDFSADAPDETAVFKAVMPNNYAGTTGVTVSIIFAMSSDHDPAHKVRWDAGFSLIHDFSATAGVQAITGDGFAAVNSVTGNPHDDIGKTEQANITFTNGADMDSVEKNDGYLLKITRDADHATDDDATGDAELWAIIIKET